MMRGFLSAPALLAFIALTGASAADGPARSIDLDRPGAMEALARDNPVHHAKIERIIAGVLQRPEREVPRWLQTSFAASDVSFAPVILTSDPPKRRLSFALDGTRYLTLLTLSHVKGTIVPAD
jgi:hypothetical protein